MSVVASARRETGRCARAYATGAGMKCNDVGRQGSARNEGLSNRHASFPPAFILLSEWTLMS